MESRAKFLGHAVHPMLIVFPLGLLPAALLFDVVALVSGQSVYGRFSYLLLGLGLLGALVAAPFGSADWLAIPKRTRAWRVGLLHGTGNLLAVLLFFASWIMRRGGPGVPEIPAVLLVAAGNAIALCTAWLGGELVERLSVGVDEGANLNAPSSLRHRSLKGTEAPRETSIRHP